MGTVWYTCYIEFFCTYKWYEISYQWDKNTIKIKWNINYSSNFFSLSLSTIFDHSKCIYTHLLKLYLGSFSYGFVNGNAIWLVLSWTYELLLLAFTGWDFITIASLCLQDTTFKYTWWFNEIVYKKWWIKQ